MWTVLNFANVVERVTTVHTTNDRRISRMTENYEHLISNIDTHDSYMWYFYDKFYICSCFTKRKC